MGKEIAEIIKVIKGVRTRDTLLTLLFTTSSNKAINKNLSTQIKTYGDDVVGCLKAKKKSKRTKNKKKLLK